MPSMNGVSKKEGRLDVLKNEIGAKDVRLPASNRRGPNDRRTRALVRAAIC